MNKGGNIARPAGSVEGCEKTSHAEKAGECQSLFLILAFGSLFCFFFLQPAGSVAIRPSALFCEPFSLGASCCCTRHSPSCFGTELSLEVTHRSHGSGWSNHAAVEDRTGLGALTIPPIPRVLPSSGKIWGLASLRRSLELGLDVFRHALHRRDRGSSLNAAYCAESRNIKH